MTGQEEPHRPYAYHLWIKAKDPSEPRPPEQPLDETLLAIRSTLIELTEGCEIRERSTGLYCVKHERPVEKDRIRCDFLVRRERREGKEDPSKAQIQEYVNEILGIRDDRTVKRLTGLR
ncbi:MAG: hypothetical protein OK438_01360 [Thaumarchaeota archaeon]|nr:hypothetical protein [Nitrososphaerota archaeon]